MGRNLPVQQPTLFKNADYLLSDGTITGFRNNKPYWQQDSAVKENVDNLQLVFAGDPNPLVTTTWGGAPTAWYYGFFDTNSTNPFNTTLAFSASNPEAEYPWHVEQWIPLEAFSIYQAPTAVPIVLTPPTIDDVNRFTGLSGWVIENASTGSIIASAVNPTKVEKPWEITSWVDLSTGTEYSSIGTVIEEELNLTQNPEVSAWYWQYTNNGSSFFNAYSADSIEAFPWDVPYEAWNFAGTVYTNPPPKIIKPEVLPITVEPLQSDAYLNTNFSITPYNGGSLLKSASGVLGYKLEAKEPRFSFSLGPLKTDTDWYMVGMTVSGNAVKLYKDLNFDLLYENNTTLGLSSISIGASNVDIGQALVYDRRLSDNEIVKTYRWFKGRYKKNVP